MPFDPNLPQAGTEIDAVQMRSQLNGLKALIDAIHAINAAQIDGVTTVNPGDPATASVAVVGNTLGFTLGIPRGYDGQVGQEGQTGGVGPQGPPFANAVVDAVNTLPAGTPATVSVSFDGTLVHFVFGLPAGQDGVPGPPGEVTTAALTAAISGTSSNSNAVATLDTPFADPDAEALRAAYNALVLALRR